MNDIKTAIVIALLIACLFGFVALVRSAVSVIRVATADAISQFNIQRIPSGPCLNRNQNVLKRADKAT